MRDGAVPAVMRDQVSFVPLPAWVDHLPYPAHAPASGDPCVAHGICRLLHDIQLDLTADAPAWHLHHAQRVLSRGGAERAAHFLMEFNPAFQWLDIHFIRVLRGGSAIEHAKSGAIQTLRRETDLGRLVLNGELTASLLIPDVREGDIVEVALTLHGMNPVLGRTYASWLSFDMREPWRETRRRVRRPLDRDIRFTPFNAPPAPRVSVADGIEDRRWQLAGGVAIEPEGYLPPWLITAPSVQISEWSEWSTLARLFAPLYDDAVIPDELAQEIDRLAAAHPAPADRAVAWLRFVQQHLRYFALSLGQGGLMPRRVETIWAARFGDCKDMTQLYVAGARRMGLDACAALVSTTHGRVLDGMLPSPSVFNHCIVRLRHEGESYWLDPTMQRQSGSLVTIHQPHSGWALPLTAETTALEVTDDDEPLQHMAVEDEYQFGWQAKTPAKFRRTIIHSYWAADELRHQFADEGTAAYAKDQLKRLQGDFEHIAETTPMEVRDDPVKNTVTTIFTYEIHDCWGETHRENARVLLTIRDPVTARELGPLESSKGRRAPIYLARPRRITRRATIKMPLRWLHYDWKAAQQMPGVSFSDRLTVTGRTAVNSTVLVIEAWSAAANEAAHYNEIVAKMAADQLSIVGMRYFGRVFPLGTQKAAAVLAFVLIAGGAFAIAALRKHFH